jgi:Rrf2 family protein
MLSSRGKYATRAVLDLVLNDTGRPALIQDIAERQNIPVKFLEQILLSLKRMGFVKSRKGRGGGYSLAMPPEAITLGAIVRAIDGPLAPISCVSVTAYGECGCAEPATCALRTVWQEARNALAEVLDNATFADIRDRAARIMSDECELADYII